MLKDSGKRRSFETGAVRDMSEGKGRFDLAPLDVVSEIIADSQLQIRLLRSFTTFKVRMMIVTYYLQSAISFIRTTRIFQRQCSKLQNISRTVRKNMAKITGRKDYL